MQLDVQQLRVALETSDVAADPIVQNVVRGMMLVEQAGASPDTLHGVLRGGLEVLASRCRLLTQELEVRGVSVSELYAQRERELVEQDRLKR